MCFMFVFAMLSCLFLAALWSPARERAGVLALLFVMFSCVFITFPSCALGQVSNLIVSTPDLCLLYLYYAAPFSRIISETTLMIFSF